MDIASRLDFAADPNTVYGMLTDNGFLEELVGQSQATSHSIDIAGPTTRVEMALEAPSALRSVVGSTVNLVQVAQWGEAAADGSRDGTLKVEVAGMPVTMDGTARLYPGGRGTVVDYAGQLSVRIPLLGRTVEQQAAPYVKDAIDAQQQVGDAWLAAHPQG